MKTRLTYYLAFLFLTAVCALPSRADDLDRLQGHWVAKNTNDEGQVSTLNLDLAKNKLTFKILNAEKQVSLYAEGEIELKSMPPFKVIHFFNLKAGASAADLQTVEDERNTIYTFDDDGNCVMAGNFDKTRDNEKPNLTTYHKVEEKKGASLHLDKMVVHETPQSAAWFLCFEATVNGTTRKYNVPGKSYEKSEVTIPLELTIPSVAAGDKCSFVCQLDDVDEDACGNDPDNRSTGTLLASDSGSQTFKPEDKWSYTIYWRLN